MEIREIVFNKSNIINVKGESILRSNLSVFYSKKEDSIMDYRLYIGLMEGTLENMQKVSDIIANCYLFCCDDQNINYTLKEIFLCSYIRYSKNTQEIQSIHIQEAIVVEDIVTLSYWDYENSETPPCFVSEGDLDYDRGHLKELWKLCIKNDSCGRYPIWNEEIIIIPTVKAKKDQCEKLKRILDKLTPFNSNWTVKYQKRAICYLKCENQELANRVHKKVSRINKCSAKRMKNESLLNVPGITISSQADITFGTQLSDPESIYVIVKDAFVFGQIQMFGLGKQCNTCDKFDNKMNKCSGCQKIYYCNRECQLKDWPNHKQICKLG
jgi:methyl coenzyme M reductase subunit D